MKTCDKCCIKQDLNQFAKRKSSKDGFKNRCKKCTKQDGIEYRNKNKEQLIIKRKEYYQKNKEEILQQQKKYNDKNMESILNYHKEWYRLNIEECKQKNKEYKQKHTKETHEHYIKNRDKISQYQKQHNSLSEVKLKNNNRDRNKRKTNIQYHLGCNLRSRLNMAIKNSQKTGSAVRDLGCSIDELKYWIENQFVDGMSWGNWGIGNNCWQIDHIVPAHMLDLSNNIQLLIFCNYRNLRPMWQIDNITRDYKDVEENKQIICLALGISNDTNLFSSPNC